MAIKLPLVCGKGYQDSEAVYSLPKVKGPLLLLNSNIYYYKSCGRGAFAAGICPCDGLPDSCRMCSLHWISLGLGSVQYSAISALYLRCPPFAYITGFVVYSYTVISCHHSSRCIMCE